MQQFLPSLAVRLGLMATLVLPAAALAAPKPAAAHGTVHHAAAETPAKPGASAATPQELGSSKSWSAYAYNEKGSKVCYLVGKPSKSEPANVSRGRVDAMITHRPGEKAVNVITFDVGYPFKEGSSAELEVDSHKFTLFTDKDAAWAPDPATDKAVTEALAKGKRAVLKGTSQRGTNTTDTYTLDGLGHALSLIDKSCDVKR